MLRQMDGDERKEPNEKKHPRRMIPGRAGQGGASGRMKNEEIQMTSEEMRNALREKTDGLLVRHKRSTVK